MGGKGEKLIRERRGRVALWVTVLSIVVTLLAVWVGPTIAAWLRWPLASRVQIAYAGASLLVVVLVLMFGVGNWSRYVPEESDVSAPPAGKPDASAHPDAPGEKVAPNAGQEGGPAHVVAP